MNTKTQKLRRKTVDSKKCVQAYFAHAHRTGTARRVTWRDRPVDSGRLLSKLAPAPVLFAQTDVTVAKTFICHHFEFQIRLLRILAGNTQQDARSVQTNAPCVVLREDTQTSPLPPSKVIASSTVPPRGINFTETPLAAIGTPFEVIAPHSVAPSEAGTS